ncbi:leaf rust 10 disease-resistance locus receptor-like protein kinase-like 1.1 protein [Tanacetum coccineum]
MILVFVFVSVFLSSLPLLHSATESNMAMPTCPESFSCPRFASFNYPFYNGTKECGLIKVKCNSTSGNIQIGGQKYEIVGKFDSSSSILIYSKTFAKLVNTTNCAALMHNFTSPSPLLYSISIIPFLNLFKCPKSTTYAEGTNAYFNQPNYNSYNTCKDHNFYYEYSVSNATVPSDLPHGCQVIQLPVIVQLHEFIKLNVTNIFSILSPTFSISVQLSTSCFRCKNRGGQCDTHNGMFQCLHPKKGKPSRHLILIVGFAFILMLCLVIFIIRRLWKNSPFWYFSSKDESRCLEDGSIFFSVSVFSYAELEDATNFFDPSRELGGGGFGTVYHGKLQDGREVAVKRLYEHNYNRLQQFINEVEILTKLRHPNLLVLYGCTSRISRELLLVYEYISNGTVYDHLHGQRAKESLLTWPIRMNIAIETASALVYLHANEIIHRDVKTNNILLDHNYCVKVADFGLSRLMPNNVNHVSTAPQGTPGYVDPQYHQRYQLTDKSDVYSFGVVLVELISSMVAVDLNRSQDEISLANLALSKIQRCELDQLIDPVLVSDPKGEIMVMITSVAELAFRCLQYHSEMRPTMSEVLDVLMDIQGEGEIDDNDSIRDLESVKAPPPSKASDTVVLLKDFLPSPVSVTSEWQSETSASTTISSNGDRLSMKNPTSH